jgi:transcriptional regulator with XRE-family HTH domain
MELSDQISDTAILQEMGERFARRRLDQNRTQAELAREAGVSKRTVERLEKGGSTQVSSLIRVMRALGLLANLDTLVPPAVPSPMERLKLQGRERRRASSGERASESSRDTWTWGDEP